MSLYCSVLKLLFFEAKLGWVFCPVLFHGFLMHPPTKSWHNGVFQGGASPLEWCYLRQSTSPTFWTFLHGFRVPGNDILALDEGPNSVVCHMVTTRFLYRHCQQARSVTRFRSLPNRIAADKANVASNFSGFSSETWHWPTLIWHGETLQPKHQSTTNVIVGTLCPQNQKVGVYCQCTLLERR